MTAYRKAISNRKNAQRSTGPRSELGRRHSRRNALRHGLAVAIGSDPSFHEDIEVLAMALMGGRGEENVGEFARQAAEAETDLLRIRKHRASRFNSVFGGSEPRPEDLTQLDAELAKLERYERRAFSRRRNALRAMSECCW
jgi:hypothetical protein